MDIETQKTELAAILQVAEDMMRDGISIMGAAKGGLELTAQPSDRKIELKNRYGGIHNMPLTPNRAAEEAIVEDAYNFDGLIEKYQGVMEAKKMEFADTEVGSQEYQDAKEQLISSVCDLLML